MFRLLAPSRASPAGRILIRSELDRRREMRPKIDGILESSLYVSDLGRSVRFYRETFGFSVISEFGERGCALQAGRSKCCCCSKKEPRATFHHRTTAMANFIWRLPFP